MRFDHGHALLIGIGSYRNASYLNVAQTANDVDALATVLQNERFCGYPADNILPVFQREQATSQQILNTLDNLAKNTEAEDTVLIFYAGHGQQGTDGYYYLTTHDTEMRGSEVLAGSGIPIATFLEKLQAIPAQRLLFLCNACYAGQIPPNFAPHASAKSFVTPPLPTDAKEALLSAGKGRILITACSADQESQTGGGEITFFTQAVIEALKGYGVKNQNGYISIFDLYQHVHDRVMEQAATIGEEQEPELTILGGTGSFPVALHQGTSSPGRFSPETTPPSGSAVHVVSEEQSQRSLSGYVKPISASGTGANAAEHVGRDQMGGGNTYVQTATGSGHAQAAGTYAQATVNIQGMPELATNSDSKAKAIALLQSLLVTLKYASAASQISKVASNNAKAQIEAALEEIQQSTPDKSAILDYLAEAQRVMGDQVAVSATPLAEAIKAVHSL